MVFDASQIWSWRVAFFFSGIHGAVYKMLGLNFMEMASIYTYTYLHTRDMAGRARVLGYHGEQAVMYMVG